MTRQGQDVVARRTWIGELARLAQDLPHDVAIEDHLGRSLTRRQLVDRAASARVALIDRAVAPGDRVAVHLENTIENAVLVLALGAMGAVCVPVSPKLTRPEVERQVGSCRPQLFVTDTALTEETVNGDLGVPVVSVTSLVDLDGSDDDVRREAFLADATSRQVEEPSTIICTSGSTSAPKPIVLSFGNITFAIVSSQSYYALGPRDVGLTVFPWCHSNGHINQLLCWLTLGVRVCVAERFTASGFAAQLEWSGATVAPLNGTHVKMVLAHLSADAEPIASRLRVVPTALELSADDVRRFTHLFGALLRKVYYQTELVAPVTVGDLYPPRAAVNNNPLGHAALSHELRLVDEDGRDVEPGAPGEILVRSNLPFWIATGRIDVETGELVKNDPAAWWYTGDLAVAEPDGFLYYAGRTSEMVKRAGHNVAIAEVVATLSEHPGVAEAAVIGAPDPFREEQIIAFVVGEVDEADVIAFCASRLAEYKVPSRVLVVGTVPRTDLGKLDVAALRSSWSVQVGGR